MSIPTPRVRLPGCGALALVALSLSPPASAAPAVEIVGVESGRCLDVTGNTTQSRTPVNLYDCIGQRNQLWTPTELGELKVHDDDTCLDVRGQSRTAPAVAQIYRCNGGQNQRWTFGDDGTIVGVQSGLCLDVFRRATGNGATVGMYTCNGQSNQRWEIVSRDASPDTQPPGPPASVRVSDLVCDGVTLSWNASTDDVGIVAYDVYHDGQFIEQVGAGTLSTRVELVPGTPWGLYVNARDAAGNVSQASDTVPVSPPNCNTDTKAPSVPSGLAGTTSGTSVTLAWTPSSDDVAVRAYDVYQDDARVGSVDGNGGGAPDTTFTDSGLLPNTDYRYRVSARDAQGNASARSDAVVVRTGGGCSTAVCGAELVANDTDIPWGLDTLPDGSVLYTRRDAHDIVRLDPVTGAQSSIGTVPNVQGTDGEGGLLGLAVSPSFASDRWLYLMHTTPDDVTVVRIRYENGALQTGTEQVLLTGIQRNKFHDGGRLRFGPDGKLYASSGDAQTPFAAQDTSNLNGKILRIDPDGGIPADNPFGNAVWSYGHRNPQGIAFDSQGRLWAQEFGNSAMDETNLIVGGGNYGWPECEGTVPGPNGGGGCEQAGFIAPKATYPTSEGSCSGIAIVDDALYVACLRGDRMYRHEIDGARLTNRTEHFNGAGYGRLRTVEPAATGGLWLTTSNGDKDSAPDNSDTRILRVTLGR